MSTAPGDDHVLQGGHVICPISGIDRVRPLEARAPALANTLPAAFHPRRPVLTRS